MAYEPIENYGIVGDLKTVSLISMKGSVDWLCFPRFDSPSVFGALLDDRKGGFFSIMPDTHDVKRKQFYWPQTNVLVTRFFCKEGVADVTDYMPVGGISPDCGEMDGCREESPQLVRRVTVRRGRVQFIVRCYPSFDYARTPHTLHLTDGGCVFRTDTLALGLATRVNLVSHEGKRTMPDEDGNTLELQTSGPGVEASFTLSQEERRTFVLEEVDPDTQGHIRLTEDESDRMLQETIEYWRDWVSHSTYKGRWREMVQRSALVLKLLSCKATGALVAAPTTSLPESAGGSRNWDYRYTWIRDAAFTLSSLLRIGLTQEASDFMEWIEARAHELRPDGSLQIMYGVDGTHELPEQKLDHLDGYRGAKPVRVGNGAYDQLQLDIYGELMDAILLFDEEVTPISYDLWIELRRLVDWVCNNWERKDAGIWETRGGDRHFTYSKLMCWVAVDRGIRLADRRSFPADRSKWYETRDRIYEEIIERAWDEERGAFVQAYDGDDESHATEHGPALDASTLMIPLMSFLSPSDRRVHATLDAILKPPRHGGLVSNGLTYRYNVKTTSDGLQGQEGTFNVCTFWLVEAMAEMGRADPERVYSARFIFEQMLGYANHLGLFAEETGPSGEALGNFPQALTHLGLINAAYRLDKVLG